MWTLDNLHAVPQYVSAKTNLVFVGDSLTYGTGASNQATTSYPAQLQTMSSINNGLVINNQGVPGSNSATALANPTAVDNSYVSGLVNIMVIAYGTNGVRGDDPSSGAAEGARLGLLIAHYLSVHPDWKIAVCTTIPRGIGATQSDRDAFNVSLNNLDNYIRANWRAYGAKMLVETRPKGGIFDFQDYLPATFINTNMYLTTEPITDQTHLNDFGYFQMAQVRTAIRRLPVRY